MTLAVILITSGIESAKSCGPKGLLWIGFRKRLRLTGRKPDEDGD